MPAPTVPVMTTTSLALMVAASFLLLSGTAHAAGGVSPVRRREESIFEATSGALQHVLDELRRPDRLSQHVVRAADSDPRLATSATACTISVARWALGLNQSEQWALQMVDSSSKFVTGMLYGNLADLGNFDECVASGDTSTMGFSGRYALVALAIQKAVPGNTTSQKTLTLQLTRNVFLDQPRNTSKRGNFVEEGEGVQYTSVLTVHVGACVPSTCTEAVVREALASVAAAVNGRYLNGTAMRLQTDIPKGASAIAGPYREAEFRDLFVISLCVLLLLLLLVGTVLDLTLRTDDKQTRQNAAALLAFSAWTNGRRLLTISPPSDSNFTCINGIRFLSAMWVVMGHRYYAGLQIPFTNFIPFTQRMHDLSFMMVVNALLSVDTFFVMGGMVNCYVIMKVTRGRKSFNWIMYYVHRYIRLTPAFALMVAITATWICLLGTGPLWHKVVIVSSDNCRNNWWASLLYVDIYTDPNHRCMMQTWYLMTDMQMHWLSPLLLYPLYRWRRAGLAWLAFLLVASAIVPAVITYVYELPSPLDLMDTPDKMRFFMEGMYYPPYTRATPYVFGTLMGYGLHLINSGQIKKPVLSRTVILLGWLCSATLCLTVLFSAQPLFDKANHPYNVWEHTVYAGLHRLAWAIGLSWVLMACILGYGGPVNALLSWSPFTVLGRLSYGIYLTHAAVHMVDMGSVRTSSYYSDFNMVKSALSDVIIACILGICLTLSMESPVMAIEKILFGGVSGKKPASRNGADAAHRGEGPMKTHDEEKGDPTKRETAA